MQVGVIQNRTYAPKKTIDRKNQSNPSFAAKVNILDIYDTISGGSVEIKQAPLNYMAEKLKKVLENFDPNLIFDISGTKKLDHFFDIFRNIEGLKVDIKYFDKKKAYFDILNKSKQDQLLKEMTIDGLKRKDATLLNQLSERIGVGKYFRPKTETQDQYVEKLSNMIKQEIIVMPNRLLESKNIERDADGTFHAWNDFNFKKGSDFRNICSWYKGIEY